MLGTCAAEVSFEGNEPSPPPSTPTPTTPTVAASVVNSVAPRVVFVTEFMANPSAVNDAEGEWFELYNSRSDVGVDINGWTIRDEGSNNHVINNGAPLIIPSLGFLVLGKVADSETNGGVPVDYAFSTSFTLANSEDEIQLPLTRAPTILPRIGADLKALCHRVTEGLPALLMTLAPNS